MTKRGTGPLACSHANEKPAVCPCSGDCYCKAHTCAPKCKDCGGTRRCTEEQVCERCEGSDDPACKHCEGMGKILLTWVCPACRKPTRAEKFLEDLQAEVAFLRRERLRLAHECSSWHRANIEKSKLCGCFCCEAMFAPVEITQWIDAYGDPRLRKLWPGGGTAMCPKCGIDAVVGDASGLPITEDFLKSMSEMWFGQHRKEKR